MQHFRYTPASWPACRVLSPSEVKHVVAASGHAVVHESLGQFPMREGILVSIGIQCERALPLDPEADLVVGVFS